jgi:putative tryptophan/tyrosine transport system substrate-binding protein
MMDRRRFLLTSLAGALAAPLVAGAQQAGRVYRVGYLAGWSRQTHDYELERALGRLGWIMDENLFVEYRWTEGKYERYAALAAELVRLKPHVIVAPQTAAALAMQKATSSIPIVMVFIAEPVGLGLVQSLARPGGNITGTTLWGGWEIFAKQLQLLREVAPGVSRVAVLWNPANRPAHALVLKSVDAAARSMWIDLHPQGVQTRDELEAAFATIVQAGAGALLEISTSSEMLQRAAAMVDKILRGADPAVLPVEEPTKFELTINLKTAKALGLTIPPSLLQRADQVIE